MKHNLSGWFCCLLAAMALVPTSISAAKKPAPQVLLTKDGEKLETQYAAQFVALQKEIMRVLPVVDEKKSSALQQARDATKAAEKSAKEAQQSLGKVQAAKGLVEHAKGKWIGGAEKGITQAQAALTLANTENERAAAKKDLAKWQANKEAGLKALGERQVALDKINREFPVLIQANALAQAALDKARASERAAAMAILSDIEPFLASATGDAKLVKAAVLAAATPRGLAEFAQQGSVQTELLDRLMKDAVLMQHMLTAGGAKFAKYGQAMQIYAAIQQTSPRAENGVLERLALATSLEHAVPITQSNAQNQTEAPTSVDPVKRYQHYAEAYLEGALDPAFQNFSAWELRMVVGCDAPDPILAWGREMLRNYRPDHSDNPDYGWRYASTVRTEVLYGSQNVKYDLPSLQAYQNILRNGGVCGRRAFFGRFILRSFGIPTWGVTQKAHAALSHWTPKGWVVNFGAGFEHSWWDKDEAPRSGVDFLRETQARKHVQDYTKVLRARWISQVLGEQAYNDRMGVVGGFWSGLAQDLTELLADTAVKLDPLGQELAEANDPKLARISHNLSRIEAAVGEISR